MCYLRLIRFRSFQGIWENLSENSEKFFQIYHGILKFQEIRKAGKNKEMNVLSTLAIFLFMLVFIIINWILFEKAQSIKIETDVDENWLAFEKWNKKHWNRVSNEDVIFIPNSNYYYFSVIINKYSFILNLSFQNFLILE